MVNPQYGCQVDPDGPLQDMSEIDIIAGAVHDRSAPEQTFTGGLGPMTGEPGLGGRAIGAEPQTAPVGGV